LGLYIFGSLYNFGKTEFIDFIIVLISNIFFFYNILMFFFINILMLHVISVGSLSILVYVLSERSLHFFPI